MSKLTPILASAALAATIGAWSSPSARADINIGLYDATTGASTLTVSNGGTVTVDVIATFSNVPGGGSGINGVMDLAGIFAASAPGGSYATPTLDTNFNGTASTVGTNVGTINGGWGVDSTTGPTANYVFFRSNYEDPNYAFILAPVTTAASTSGPVAGGVLLGQITYTAPATSGLVTLGFQLSTSDPNTPAVIWVQNEGTSSTLQPTGGLVNVAPTGSGDIVGTATVSGLTLNVGGASPSAVWANSSDSANGWGTAGNWSTGSVPTVGATFNGTEALNPGKVNLGTAQSINTVTIASASVAYTISGSALTIGQTAPGNITVNSPGSALSHTISAPVVLNNDSTIEINNPAGGGTTTLALSGGINGQGHNLTVNDSISTTPGKVVLGGPNGGEITNINTLTVAAGTVQLAALSGAVTRQTPAAAVVLGGLTVAPGATLDITNRDLIIHGGSESTIAALLASGYNGGAWNGTGIISSMANSTNLGVGYATAAELGVSSFDGVSVSPTDLLVKFTYYEDTNLDGAVTLADAANFGAGFTHTGPAADWFAGNANYDTAVNLADAAIFGTNFTKGTGGANGQPLSLGINDLGGSVPEPASIGILALGCLGLLTRRPGRAARK